MAITKHENTDNVARFGSQEVAGRYLMEAVRQQGYEPTSIEDAWGKVILVQAEIALNPEMGSKATTAAKFLMQVSGYFEEKDQREPEDERGQEDFQLILELIDEEKIRREL